MKIKSITDVVTNSSSETYLINTELSCEEAKKEFMDFIKKDPDAIDLKWNPNPDTDETIVPEVTVEKDGILKFNWDILCNIDNVVIYLKILFGSENVQSIW